MTTELLKRLSSAANEGIDSLSQEVMSIPPKDLVEVLMQLLEVKSEPGAQLVEVSLVDGKDPDHELLPCTVCEGKPVEKDNFCGHCGGTKQEYRFAPLTRFADIEPWVWHDYLVSRRFALDGEGQDRVWAWRDKQLPQAKTLTHDSPKNHIEFFRAVGQTIRQIAFHHDDDAATIAEDLIEFWRN